MLAIIIIGMICFIAGLAGCFAMVLFEEPDSQEEFNKRMTWLVMEQPK